MGKQIIVFKKYKLKKVPFFDKEGNFWMPNNIKFGGQMHPILKPKLWFYYLLIQSKDVPKEAWNAMIGSKSTEIRTKNELIKLGYIHEK